MVKAGARALGWCAGKMYSDISIRSPCRKLDERKKRGKRMPTAMRATAQTTMNRSTWCLNSGKRQTWRFQKGNNMSKLAFKSATELAAMIRAKEISAVELLEHYLDRVERYNPDLNAIIVLDVERARVRAREADAALAKGEVWGSLHGVPMSIQESENLSLQTTWRGRRSTRSRHTCTPR